MISTYASALTRASTLARWSLALPALLLCGQAHAAVESGLWYDRTHSGHGFDLHRAGGTLFGTLYTYSPSGAPRWLWIQTEDSSAPTGELTRYRRLSDGSLSAAAEGSFAMTPVSECADGIARPGARALLQLQFSLEDRPLLWCIEPLLPTATVAESALSGAWFDPNEPGWGLFTHAWMGSNGAALSYRTIYFHDEEGEPRWAFAQDPISGLSQAQNYFTPYTECFTCSPSPPLTTPVGSASLKLTQPIAIADAALNHISLSLSIDGDPSFNRSVALAQLSEPLALVDAAGTTEGPIGGLRLDADVAAFRNIPYAAAPVGPLRWRAPQAQAPREQGYTATEYGPGCVQPPGQGFFSGAPASQSEDCLQLNIWRPTSAGTHPVMLWIHGGGLTQGSAVQRSGESLLYDGAEFAARGVVFVSINYRLGPFGYLAHRRLLGEAPEHPQSGNYGLLDQIAALHWVRDNILSFGGDPNQITIFGESAGGLSVCALLAAPAAQGLFARAIMQSGNCLNQLPTLVDALDQGDRVTAAAGCDSSVDPLACLRTLNAQSLLQAANPVINTGVPGAGEMFGLIHDGFVLPSAPGPVLAAGTAAPVPLLIGINDDEQSTLSPATSLPATVAGYEAAIRAIFPLLGNAVLGRYPAAAYPTPQHAYQDLLDDLRFTCANRRAAADHAANGHPVYHYVLTEVLPDLASLQSFHGLDVILLFTDRAQALASEQTLAERMRSAWVDFAHGLAPASSEGLNWPSYSASQRHSQELNGHSSAVIDDYRGDYCAFWASFLSL